MFPINIMEKIGPIHFLNNISFTSNFCFFLQKTNKKKKKKPKKIKLHITPLSFCLPKPFPTLVLKVETLTGRSISSYTHPKKHYLKYP